MCHKLSVKPLELSYEMNCLFMNIIFIELIIIETFCYVHVTGRPMRTDRMALNWKRLETAMGEDHIGI